MAKSLLLDFGGVCLLTPFELHRHTEKAYGLEPGTLNWYGPLDPDSDPMWKLWQAGAMTEREYWARRAAEIGAMVGRPGIDVKTLFDPVYDLPEDVVLRPEMVRLADEARRRGVKVGLLTNDLHDFQTAEWIARMTFLARLNVIVDGSHTKILKPDLRAYELGVQAMNSAAGQIVFVDDQRRNVDAANTAGLLGVWFSPADPVGSVARVRVALGWSAVPAFSS